MMLRFYSLYSLALACVVLALVAGCDIGFNSIPGSGTVITQNRVLADFEKIQLSGVGRLEFVIGEETACSVELDDNLQEYLVTDVANGTLKINLSENISATRSPTIKITHPKLTEIQLSGATTGDLTGIDAASFTIGVSGASRIVVAGKAALLSVTASGASKVFAEALVAQDVEASATGASSITAHAEKTLKAEASGASSIAYMGEPQTKKSVSGASEITKIGG